MHASLCTVPSIVAGIETIQYYMYCFQTAALAVSICFMQTIPSFIKLKSQTNLTNTQNFRNTWEYSLCLLSEIAIINIDLFPRVSFTKGNIYGKY